MELRQLHTFRTVAQVMNFSRAATKLNYAQSTVSTQIHALEEELGVSLFDRLGKKVGLTDAGKHLLGYSEQMLDLADEARMAVSDWDTVIGVLRISAPETLCAYRLPRILRQFRMKFPEVQLVFMTDLEIELQRPIHEGAVDIAFFFEEPFQDPHLVVEALVPEPLLIVTYPAHPLAQKKKVTFQDLYYTTLIQTEGVCSYRRMFEQEAKAKGVRLIASMEFHSVEAIKQCVMARLGVAVLPEIAVQAEIAQGRLVILDLDGPPLEIATQIVYHKNKSISPAMRAFIDITRRGITTNSLSILQL